MPTLDPHDEWLDNDAMSASDRDRIGEALAAAEAALEADEEGRGFDRAAAQVVESP